MSIDTMDLVDKALIAPSGEDERTSASKTLALLEAISKARGTSFGVTQVASDIGVPKSTAHRLLKALEEHGFVDRTGSRYRVGGSFFELSEAAQWSEFGELRDIAWRPLNWLFERSGAMAVHLAVLSGSDVLYLDKITRPAGTRLPSRVGGRFPASCTALGKAILAHSPAASVASVVERPLPRITPHSMVMRQQLMKQLATARNRGFAVEREEACHGTACVAAPVMRGAVVVGAVSLSIPIAGRGPMGDKKIDGYGGLAAEAATRISRLVREEV